jgi:flavodoxin
MLVAYFSRSGNTRVVAGLIQRAMGADMFEIRPATPYPEDYLATVEQAKQESERGFEPALAAKEARIAEYDTSSWVSRYGELQSRLSYVHSCDLTRWVARR